MKVLFLTTRVGDVGSEHESYLEDSLLIGIKRILGDDCIDYSKKQAYIQTARYRKKSSMEMGLLSGNEFHRSKPTGMISNQGL